MSHRVVYSPLAEDQLADLYHYIAQASSPIVAVRYTDAIVDYCETLRVFPERGRRRDDLRPGLRVTHYKKRAVIAFHVGKDVVTVLGVFYGGQAYEPVLGAKPPAATVPYQ